jgi:hypothetical protein
LGKWPSILDPRDYLVDTSCYFLPRLLAVASSAAWFCRTREMNILWWARGNDCALTLFLRNRFPNYEASYCYTVNYRVENRPASAKREFFLTGNQIMLEKFEGHLPWKRGSPSL